MWTRCAVLAVAAAVATPGVARGDSPRFGVLADVGLPSGLTCALAYQPGAHLSTHFGLSHNLHGLGLRAGVRVSPWLLAARPYLAVEAGHFFRMSTPAWMVDVAKDAGLDDKTLERLGYTHLSGHLGLRMGSGQPAFFVQAGLSFVRAGADYIKPKPDYTPPVELYRATTVHLWMIGGQLGLVWYF